MKQKDKPEKKECKTLSDCLDKTSILRQGYNRAISDYEAFLPSFAELSDIIYVLTQYLDIPDNELALLNAKVAKAIARRIGKEVT